MRYQFSLLGVNYTIKQTSYYKSLSTIDQKNRLIDRCNFVFHQIIIGNIKHKMVKKKFSEVHIHSDSFKYVLSYEKYKEILDFLIELDLIGVNEFYVIDGYSKSFWLTKKALIYDIDKVGVLSNFMAKKLKAFRRKRFTHLLKSPIHSKQIKNLCELRFKGKKVSKTWDSKDPIAQEWFYNTTYSNLLRFNEYTSTDDYINDYCFYYYPSEYGRTYHYFSNIPRLYRYQLEHINGESIIELDLKQAQPLFLALAYEEFRYTAKPDVKQLEEQQELGYLYELNKQFISDNTENVTFSYDLIEKHDKTVVSTSHNTNDACNELGMSEVLYDCLTEDFYLKIRNHVHTMGDERLIKKYGNMSRKDIKKAIVSQGLFSKNKHIQNDIFKVMSSKYPDFMEFVRLYKIKFGHSALPQMGQSRESSIFIDGLFSEIDNEWAVTVHDAVLCLSSDAKFFNDILVGLMQKNYPFVEPSLFENVFTRQEYRPN